MKTYSLAETRDPKLFRVMNLDGDWLRYYYAPKKVYLDSVTAILDKGYAKGTGLINFFKNHTADEAEDIMNVAGEKGSRLHRAIEEALHGHGAVKDATSISSTGAAVGHLSRDMAVYNRHSKQDERLSTTEWNALLSFGNFWTKHEPQIISIEESVYNLKYGYAGTLDAILILTKACDVKICPCKDLVGKVGIYDWKSGKGLYASYGAQIASYGNAPSLKKVLGTAKPEYTALLRIGTSHKTTGGYEMVVYNKEETHTNWELFLAALKIAKTEIKPFDPEKEVYEVPDEITLAVNYKPLVEPKKLIAKEELKKGDMVYIENNKVSKSKTNDTKVKRGKGNALPNGQKGSSPNGTVGAVLQAPAADPTVS